VYHQQLNDEVSSHIHSTIHLILGHYYLVLLSNMVVSHADGAGIAKKKKKKEEGEEALLCCWF